MAVPLVDASVTEWRGGHALAVKVAVFVPLVDASVTEWRSLRACSSAMDICATR